MRLTTIATLFSLVLAQAAHAQSQVLIGSASPLSGPGAHQGKDIENGARLAIDDLNAQGATIGGQEGQMGVQALGIDATFVSGDGVCSEKLPLLAGAALGDDRVVCVVAGGVDAPLEAGMMAFAERYRKRYGMPFQTYAPYAYDATMAFAAAMRAANSTDPAQFLPALAHIKYQGITGTIAFDANGDLRDAALTLYTYRKGRLTKLRVVH